MLAVVGGKGGCGKTTTALGLSRALARRGPRPLVVDTDCSMPNLHTMADTDPRPGLGAVADGRPVERTIHRSRKYPEVDVLPAGTATGPASERALARLSGRPGPVVLDCPAGASEGVSVPLGVADRALVVSTVEPASLLDAAKTARMSSALGTPPCGAVVTRTGDSLPESPEMERLRAECRVLGTVPEVGGVLSSRAGRAAYDGLATRVPERNI